MLNMTTNSIFLSFGASPYKGKAPSTDVAVEGAALKMVFCHFVENHFNLDDLLVLSDR